MNERISIKPQNKINIQTPQMLFLLAFTIYMFANVLDLTGVAFGNGNDSLSIINLFTKMARYGAYVLLAVKFFHAAIYKRSWIDYVMTLAVIVAGSFFGSSNKIVIFYFLICIAAYDVQESNILKCSIFIQSIVLVVCVVGSQIGMIDDYVRADGGRMRHFLGFSWTTTGAILFLFILLQYIYIRKGMLTIWEDIVALGIIVFFYKMTDSRFAFLISIFTILFFALYRADSHRGRFLNQFNWQWFLVPFLVAVFAILLHACYNPQNAVFLKLNKLLSGRLALGKNALTTYGVSLIGQDIEWVGFNISETLTGTYNYVDCSYVKILLDHGILLLTVVLLAYGYILYQSVQKKEYYLTWIILIVLVFSITEPRLFDITFNPFFVLVMSGRKRTEWDDVKGGVLHAGNNT